MSETVYPDNPDVEGFCCTLVVFLLSLTVALWLDMLYGIDGVTWAFPIVFTGSVLALFCCDKRGRRLEVERALFFKKNKLKMEGGK